MSQSLGSQLSGVPTDVPPAKLLSWGSNTDLACTEAKPQEGPALALRLSSNRREMEVGQVPAGVGRKQAWAWGMGAMVPKPVPV